MRKNVGTADRVIRFISAGVLIGFLVTHAIENGRMVFLGWVGVAILVITALDQTCPLYLILGISTKRKDKAEQ